MNKSAMRLHSKTIKLTTIAYRRARFNIVVIVILRFFVIRKFIFIHSTRVQNKNSSLKKAKTVPSADKVMASDFWDARGMIFIGYLQKEKTTNGEH